MRLLIIHPKLTIGGAEKVILLMANSLKELGIDVCLAFSQVNNLALSSIRKELFSNVKILEVGEHESLNTGSAISKALSYIEDFRKLSVFISNNLDDYDVINPHNFPSYFSAVFIDRSTPVIWTCHEVLDPYGELRDYYEHSRSFKYFIKLLHRIDTYIVRRRLSAIITNSKKNIRLIAERYGRRSYLAYPPIDIDLFTSGTLRSKLLECDLSLLQVGSLVKLKNQLGSLIALKIVKREVPNSKLIIVGSGSWSRRLAYITTALGLEKDVIFISHLNDYELARTYRSSDICIHPVLEQSFGLTPFEAIASGIPVVLSDRCGAAEIFQKHAPSMLVDPAPNILARKIIEIYRNYDEFMDRVKEFRKFIISDLSPKKYSERILKIIKKYSEKDV